MKCSLGTDAQALGGFGAGQPVRKEPDMSLQLLAWYSVCGNQLQNPLHHLEGHHCTHPGLVAWYDCGEPQSPHLAFRQICLGLCLSLYNCTLLSMGGGTPHTQLC